MTATLQTRIGRLEAQTLREARTKSLPPTPAALMDEAGLKPDPWQERLLSSSSNQIILNCCRQSGKSTAVSFLALWTALSHPDSLILAVAPALRQSQELFQKVMWAYRQLDEATSIQQASALRVEFVNGSRIVVLPDSERTIRGFSAATLLLIDEASGVMDATYATLRPMLAVARSQDPGSGRLVLLSTPRGQRGFFYDAWVSDSSGWERIKVTADEIDRIRPEFLEEERRELGDLWFRQEYYAEFLAPENSVFDYGAIDAARVDDILPLVESPLFD